LEANIIAYGAGVLWTTGGLTNRKEAHDMTGGVLKLREDYMDGLPEGNVTGNDHVLLSNAYNDWALQLMNEGKYHEARGFSRRSLDIKEKHLDTRTNQFEFFISKILLAFADLADGKQTESLAMAQSAIDHIVEEKGRDHPYTQHWMFHVANIFASTGDFDKALELHQSALRARISLFGESSYAALDGYFAVALCLYRVNNYTGAIKFVGQCISRSQTGEWAKECLLRARYLEAVILNSMEDEKEKPKDMREDDPEMTAIISERNRWLHEFAEGDWKTPCQGCQDELVYFDYLVNMHSGRTTVGQRPRGGSTQGGMLAAKV